MFDDNIDTSVKLVSGEFITVANVLVPEPVIAPVNVMVWSPVFIPVEVPEKFGAEIGPVNTAPANFAYVEDAVEVER